MIKTIKIEFKIEASYIKDNPYEYQHKYYNVVEKFPISMTFRKMLDKIYEKYSYSDYSTNIKYYIYNLVEATWGNIFDNEICFKMDYTIDDYYDLTLEELERQFEISKSIFNVWLDADGIGDVVGEDEGIKFFFHMNEKDLHHVPHIHCEYSGEETRINLETLKVMDTPFKKSKIKHAIELITRNQIRLLKYWNDKVVNGEAVKFKMEI